MRSTLLFVATVAAVTAAARAQSFNIDFNAATGFAAQAPSSSFAGSLSQPGVWNAVPSVGTGPYTLNNLAGVATNVTLARSGSASDQSFNSAQTTGDYERLFDDFQSIASPSGSTTLIFNNLIPGNYTLHVFAISPASNTQRTAVSAFPSGSGNPQIIGGTMPTNGFLAGVTHSVHTVQIRTDVPSLTIVVAANLGTGTLSGLQLKLNASMGQRLYVDAAAPGQNNGSSWNDAYTSLQSALTNAAASGGLVHEVWVADGVYRPATTVDRLASFQLQNNLAIYGGFASGETSLSQRNVALNAARLNGQLGGGTPNERVYQVVDGSNTDRTAILDGFTIEMGNANGLSPNHSGAGLYISEGSPTIRNCTFANLQATVAGGAIYSKFGSPLISECKFIGNTVSQGGGIFHNGPNPLYIFNSKFLGNATMEFGGAVSILNGPVTIANCLFSGNTSGLQGSVYLSGATTNATLVNNTFINNSSLDATGGVYLADNADASITNSIFFGNTDLSASTDVQGAQLSRAGAGNVFTLERNAIEGLSGSLGGTANVTLAASPFVDIDGADNVPGTLDDDATLSPSSGSMCVDAGRNSALPADIADLDNDGDTSELLPRDLGGSTRRIDDASISDTGVGTSPIVDLGAYERPAATPPPPCAGDANGDRVVNGSDLSIMLANFNHSVTPGTGADYNADGLVNGLDLSVLLGNFNHACP